MPKPGVSVVVVSWNTRDITDTCLASLKKAVDFVKGKIDVEVIVVENASSDGTPEMIAKKHPWAKLINSGEDLGYAKGNNFGVKRTNKKNEYLLLINNDAYVRKGTISEAVTFLERHPDCDVVGCRLQYEDGRFQPSGGFLPTPVSVWGWIWELDRLPIIKYLFKPVHPRDPSFFNTDREIGWVMGAFLFLKREVFNKTHGFDEKIFMYMEEVEWCLRAKQLGFSIWYTPSFTVTHVDKASAFGDPKELAKIFRREILGLLYYLRKHYPKQMWWLLPIIKIGVFVRWLAFSLLGNEMRRDAYWQTLHEI